MKLDLRSYKNKKVFVTGHTGFKGAWLLAVLFQLGAKVKGYALNPEDVKGIYSAINGDSMCESIISDIRDKARLEQELLNFAPDYIFHLAAQPLVRASYVNPSETFEVNILGTSYLLDAVRKLKNPCSIIVITTDKVYENLEVGRAFEEGDRLGGHDPYSTSKACAELVVESFNKSFFHQQELPRIKVATARAGNVIGGGDYCKDRIIPDFIKAFEKHEKLIIRNPDSIRPWQHVLEPVVGYLMLGLFLDGNEPEKSLTYNFGPSLNDHLTVKQLVESAIDFWGSGSFEIVRQSNLHEAALLKLDISKAKSDLEWIPKYTAVQAIQKTIDWYRAEEKSKITETQVTAYLNLFT